MDYQILYDILFYENYIKILYTKHLHNSHKQYNYIGMAFVYRSERKFDNSKQNSNLGPGTIIVM